MKESDDLSAAHRRAESEDDEEFGRALLNARHGATGSGAAYLLVEDETAAFTKAEHEELARTIHRQEMERAIELEAKEDQKARAKEARKERERIARELKQKKI